MGPKGGRDLAEDQKITAVSANAIAPSRPSVEHRVRKGKAAPTDLVFADASGVPFQAEKLYRLADRAWREAGIHERLRLHQSRHTYASFMTAAGVNAKALSSFMGHASKTITFDLYGHLMPGAEAEGTALLDSYLSDQIGDADSDQNAA